MELSRPAGVSTRRGGGFPARGRRVVPLQTMAPSRWMSRKAAYSRP